MKDKISDAILKALYAAQVNEETEAIVYKRLSVSVKDSKMSEVLLRISQDETAHCKFFKGLTHKEAGPNNWKVFKYFWTAKIFGVTFALKLMENGEAGAQINYKKIAESFPGIAKVIADEERHEHELIELLDEEKLRYVGSVVLGLSDALVELTGMLAGFTLAMQNAKLIAMAGVITGIAAAFSMAASQYLAVKAGGKDDPVKSAVYTGIAYIFTVAVLIAPFLFLSNYFLALFIAMVFAITEIVIFTYYISVAKDLSFKHRFLEMAIICLSVSALSFGVGYLAKIFLNVDI